MALFQILGDLKSDIFIFDYRGFVCMEVITIYNSIYPRELGDITTLFMQ